MKFLVAVGLLGLCVSMMPMASAQAQIDSREAIALQNMVLELRQEVQALRDQIARGGGGSGLVPTPIAPSAAPSAEISAQLLDRVQRLEDDLRQLRGRVDEVDNARQRQGDDLAKQIGDLNFKMQNGAPAAAAPGVVPLPTMSPPASALGVVPAAPAKPSDALPVPPAQPRRTAEVILQEGNAAFARHDYTAAEAHAREVLTTGKGPRTTDAQFLLAESLAGRKDYTGAAVAYDDAYNRSRVGAHAQDSLLGLATSLTAIGEKKAACETLDKLHAEFPIPRADLRDGISAARRNAACR